MKFNRFLRPRFARNTKSVVLPTQAGRAAVARSAAIETLENRQLMSVTVDLRVFGASNPKVATVTSVGQVINLQAWVTVTGTTSGSNDGVQDILGSFLSTKTASGSVNGNLSANVVPNFSANGASNGTAQDLNSDGNLDVGSNNNAEDAGFFEARAGGVQSGTVSGNSTSLVIGTLTYKVTSLSSGQATDLNFRFRNGLNALSYDAIWVEDGVPRNDSNSPFGVGAPVVISASGVTPPVTGTISGVVSKSVSGSTSAFASQTVFLDTNNNGVLDSGETSTTTSSTGSYSFNNLPAGTYYLRDVVPTGYTLTSPSSSPTLITIASGSTSFTQNFTDTSSSVVTSGSLTGTVIGTSGSYKNGGTTIAKAFDGNLATYYDGASANGNYAGLDLGSTYKITSIKYAPRSGWASRMVGGIFQGSNSSTFASGVTNLATITSTPATGSLTTVTVTNTSAFRYVRYLAPSGSYGDVAEIQFFGTPSSTTTATKLSGSVYGTSGSFSNSGNTIAKAVDGSLSTYFDGPTANGNYVALDLGSTSHNISQISFAPRASWAQRMVGGIFQVSNTSNFSSGVVNIYTIASAPAYNTLTNVNVNVSGYRYVRYLSPSGSYGDIAEMAFYGT